MIVSYSTVTEAALTSLLLWLDQASYNRSQNTSR